MSDIACIYEINSLEENEQLNQDFLAGRGLDVLFCLLDGVERTLDIAQKVGIPIYSVQLYLKRLIKAGLVTESVNHVQNGQIEKKYNLKSDEIEIINRIQTDEKLGTVKQRQLDIAAQHFSIMVKRAIKNAAEQTEQPNKVKAYFMKAQKQDMQQFRDEIDGVFQKYQKLEDTQAEETYSLFTVFAPYEMEN